jgi:hypothetical protein
MARQHREYGSAEELVAAHRHARRVPGLRGALTYGEGRWWQRLIAAYGPLRDLLLTYEPMLWEPLSAAMLHVECTPPAP